MQSQDEQTKEKEDTNTKEGTSKSTEGMGVTVSLIGRTSSPEFEPNKTNKFCFWLKSGTVVNPTDFVVAEHTIGNKKTKTVGMVTEISAFTDARSHLTNFISSELGDPDAEPYVNRISSLVAEATVLRNDYEIYMPVPSNMKVEFPDIEMIEKAIGIDLIEKQEDKIPAGVIVQSNDMIIPVHLDARFFLGPEGAHINASGISGLATKTSYLMFLLNSIYQKAGGKVAVIVFNVKYSDLLHIHEKADWADQSTEKANLYKNFYKSLKLNIEPFPKEKVKYFLPRGSGGVPNSENPPENYGLYAYELRDVYGRFDLLFSDVRDEWHTLDAFNCRVRESWDTDGNRLVVGREAITNWTQLKNVDPAILATEYHLHPTTPPRILRELRRLTTSNIFTDSRSTGSVYLGEEIKKIEAEDIFVIDIFRIPSRTQPFIVGDVMRSIEEIYTEKDVDFKIIILIDELNTFAPYSGGDAITQQIAEIAIKGRSRGTILFGAEQFKSGINDLIIGNSSTNVLGKTGMAELRRPQYGFLADDNMRKIATNLGKGEMILSFPTWKMPIKIKFPEPTCKKMEKGSKK